MTDLIAASFDEALQLFADRYGELPERIWGKAPFAFGKADPPMGFHARSDVGERSTVDGTPLPTMWDEFNKRLTMFNRQHDALVALVSFPVNVTTDRVAIPRRARMEAATEFGQPALIRTERVARAYDLEHFDLGFGFTQEFLDDATDREIQEIRTLAEEAWRRRQRQSMLERLMLESNYTDAREGLSVLKLYNGDGEVPPDYNEFTHAGTHDHYLFSAGVAFALADVTTMEDHLIHHGYGDITDNGAGGDLVLLAGRTAAAQVAAFTGYVPAPTASTVSEFANSGVLVGTRPGGPGVLTVQGYLGRFAVVEYTAIPDGYMVGLATGGEFATQNPIGQRMHRNPSARGLRLNPGRREYPLQDSFYDGYIGGGVRHRGAAVCMFEDTGAGAAYVDPTF
jgi:hypothetical protein